MIRQGGEKILHNLTRMSHLQQLLFSGRLSPVYSGRLLEAAEKVSPSRGRIQFAPTYAGVLLGRIVFACVFLGFLAVYAPGVPLVAYC
jgi:hypothetical protein